MINTEIFKLKQTDADYSDKIAKAAEVIKSGGLVVFPTETVYGLGADATNPEAARKIFAAKGRPSDNPLIIHISSPEEAEGYAYTGDVYYQLAETFMPGPLTVIMDSKDTVPLATRGGLETVAVRCPENKIAHDLILAAGKPLAAPSANLSGTPSATSAQHVIDDMMGRVDVIIDGGDSEFGIESTIVKIDAASTVTLLRPGKITVDELSSVCGSVKIADAVTNKLREGERALSPGMKYRHYAPTAPLVLLDGEVDAAISYIKKQGKQRAAIIAYEDEVEIISRALGNSDCYAFGKRNDEIAQARILFALLRKIDKKNYDIIYAPLPSLRGVGLALYNRMIRAAAHNVVKL